MIELDFSKLLLVAVIALIVLGPEKLPKAARMAGAMLRRLRVGWESVRTEVERELELEEFRRAAKEAADSAEALRKAAASEMHSAHAAVKETAAKVSGAAAEMEHAVTARESRDGDT
ncbi:MAG: Sec-independent protein translocase protein TatB [Rhodanobacteraceae bacterium]